MKQYVAFEDIVPGNPFLFHVAERLWAEPIASFRTMDHAEFFVEEINRFERLNVPEPKAKYRVEIIHYPEGGGCQVMVLDKD